MKAKRRIIISIVTILVLLCICYLQFDQPFFFQHGKGGFGPAGNDVYVVINGKRNEICWGTYGAMTWTGKAKEKQETVVFDGSRVVPFRWPALKNRPVIFRFTPERIYIYDLKNCSGGYYLRGNQ
jgi:hypothetical protein